MRLSRQRIVTCVASVDRRSQGSLGEGGSPSQVRVRSYYRATSRDSWSWWGFERLMLRWF